MRSRHPLSPRRLVMLAGLVAVMQLVTGVTAHAQGAGGFSEYMVLGSEDHVWRLMERVRATEGGTFVAGAARMNSVVSATATADDQIVYYDHWEDGFEPTDILGGGAITISSITRAGAVATVTTGVAHGFATGDLITIAGAAENEYNGSFVITSTGASTFTYPVTGTPTSPATTITGLTALRHQTTTLILGDGNSLNGRVCDWSTDPRVAPCNGVDSHDDVLFAGTILSLSSTEGLAGACVAPYVAPPSLAQIRCSVPTNLGTPTTSIRFGGGDRLFNTGGGLSIAHIQDPGTPLIGGGSELIARELVKNAVAYSIPVGEDLAPGANNAFASTKYGALDIVAFDDNTSVSVNSPGVGGGTVSLTLHRGQHYSTCATSTAGAAGLGNAAGTCTAGAIDGPPPPAGPDNRGVFPALSLRLTAGTKISTTGPLNALIFTGAHGTWQTRHYATLPDILHAQDYVTTAPGPAVNVGAVKNLFIYNPDPTNSLTVTATYIGGSTPIVILPNAVRDFRNAVGPAFVPANSTVRLTSSRPFWGLTAYDATGLISDWGHAWLGVRFLANDYTIAFSPGTQQYPITQITHAAGAAVVTTDINHNLSVGSSVRIVGATIPVTSITNTVAARADVTTTGTHGLIAGDLVTIAGATSAAPNNYNGLFAVLAAPAPTATTFSYTMTAASGSTPSGGTKTVTSRLNGVRTITATTATTFTFALAGASATASRGIAVGICDATAVFPCNSYNRDPVWVGGSQNNTQVRVDLNANSLWDFIDTDSDGCPNWGQVDAPGTCEATTAPAGCPSLAANPGRCVYVVDAPGSAIVPGASPNSVRGNALRVWDWRDMDNAGTRIVSNRPVALSWGQDVDQGQNSDPSPDNGYTIYPEIAIDLVIGIDKTVTPLRVPLVGGVATYTLRIFAGDYGPLTFLVPEDALPVGVTCANFVPGSSVITFPDLTTDTNQPACLDNATGPGTRSRLTWSPSQTTLGQLQQTLITYQINIPAAPGSIPRSLENEAEVTAFLGNSKFNPKDTATLNQSDLTIVKSVLDDGSPEVGDILTYTIAVRNGATPETNVSITDAIPGFTTFVAGSINAAVPVTGIVQVTGTATVTMPVPHNYITGATITIAGAAPAAYNGAKVITVISPTTFTFAIAPATASPAAGAITATPGSAPLVGTYSAGGNSITWSGTPFAANAVVILTFRVQISASTPTGAIIPNFATYSSTSTGAAESNTVNTVVVGPTLGITKSGPPGPLHPNEDADFELLITNSGTGFARGVVVTDNITSGNLTYVPGTLSASLNANPFVPLTDASDADPANVAGTLLTYAPIRAVAPAGLTRVGTLASVTTTAPHGFVNGQAVTIAGATGADGLLWNGSFVINVTGASTFQYTMIGTPAASPAAGTITADTPLAPGSTLRIRFQASVNPGTGGLFASNQAQVTASGQPLTSSNLYQAPIIGNATITGHVFLDLNGNGVQNAGEPDLANVTVTITDSTAVVQVVETDALGNYSVVVPPGSTTLNVDQTDPDIPPGSTLSTANDPQNVIAVANITVGSTPVGYTPPPVAISKTSSGAGTVVPGQTLTYTVTVQNFSGAQTNVVLNEAIPANTTYVNSSAQLNYTSGNAIRVTEYHINNAAPDQCTEVGTDFAGGNMTCTLTLAQALAPNYFVIVQGASATGGDSTPANDHVALTGAPAGTLGVGADLTPSGFADRIVLSRGGTTNAWIGVVTVVECISANCATDPSGFRLLDVRRVAFPAAAGAASGTTNLTAPGPAQWTDITRTMLIGGANGAGCTTASGAALEHHACHPRLFPSGTNTINWARDAGGAASLDAANATVMAVQWGSAWMVQRAAILNGNNGGDGINAVGEYNTVAINPVARANTWVWGTGTTALANNGTGDSPEGVALTLGDGLVDQNPPGTGITHAAWLALNASTIAAGIDLPTMGLNFDVYALTHSQLAVDYRFLTEGNAGSPAVNQAVNSAASNRMALVYNGFDERNNDYPKPILSARYTMNTQVTIERQRTGGGDWAAWVQGVDFAGVQGTTAITCINAPPGAGQCRSPQAGALANILGTGFSLPTGGTMVLTFQVTVNAPLAGGVTQISNTASFASTQTPVAINATAIDNVVRPGVKVEPNNAGFAAVPTTGAGTAILFTQGVRNQGSTSDSFTVQLSSEIPSTWRLELIDPATGNVIATDTNGDGVWDGGVSISTGPLAVGATKIYTVRATVPFGTAAGTQNTVELTATSALSPLVKDVGTDEITVLPGATFGPVVLLPDHSGIVTAGETIAYTHRIFNNTGAPEIFDLTVDVTLGWPTTIRADTNGDGVYTPGVDLVVANTAQLPNGGSQILFIVTTAPNLTPAGTNEVAHLTARSRTNPVLVDAVTDTTTILAATTHDLAGGGTRMAAAGDPTTFPGTLYNLTATADRYDFAITPSSLFGVDGLNHPTELRVDTNGDGAPDLTIARDLDGNGAWDQLCGAPLACDPNVYNNNNNGFPDMPVPANGELAYELIRVIDPAQNIWKEYATVTATSFSTLERDSITAQWVIAALSRASIRGLRVDPAGVIEFVTGTQANTAFFNLYETAERSLEGERTLLNATPVVSPAPDSLLPILYRVETAAIKGPYLLIEETETMGNVFVYGPYSIANTRLRRGLERVEAQMNSFRVPAGPVRVSRQSMARVPGAADTTVMQRRRAGLSRLRGASAVTAPRGLVIEVVGQGETMVPLTILHSAGLPSPVPAEETLRLWRDGESVPVWIAADGGESSLAFTARSLSTDYTDKAAYVLTWEGTGDVYSPSVPLTRSAEPDRPGFTRIERNSIYAASVPGQSDTWQWDLMSPSFGPTWPYPWWDPALGDFDLPNLAPGPAPVDVKIRFVGVSDHHHVVTAQINGQTVGTVTFDGRTKALLEGSVTTSALKVSGNKLTLVYLSQNPDGTSAPAGYAYIDYLDIGAPMNAGPSTAVVTNLRPFLPTIPNPAGIRYLILTHSAFRPQADRLAALKRAERLRAAVVDVEAAYDLFSGGVQEPQAIAAMIRHTATLSPGLQYVVLFGDDSLDPRNYLGGGNPTFVPSIMGHDGSSRIPNENAYADLNGDGAPELAIGRLPVTTLAEAVAVVDKIETQSATLAASGNVHVFVSDDSRERDIHFGDSAREMSEKLPSTATSILADVGGGIGTARSAMFGAWQTGTTITHYFGHGGPEIWTDEALFSADEVPDLPAAMSPMVLLAWACQSQYYQNYYGPSVNEALFLAPATGTLASFGPVGISSPAHQRTVYERVYERLYAEGLSLGEIIRQAKIEALAADPLNQDAVDGFMFFGDPSLKLPQPRPLGRPGPRIPRP